MGIKIATSYQLIVGGIIFLLVVFCAFSQETPPSQPQISQQDEETIFLDLKGVDIREVLRMLSVKTGFTIVPSKGVSGRLNLFLNNVSFEDALDIILISQNLAAERKENIIYIMTNSEYKQLYGRDYIEKRKFKSVKLNYAKPTNVSAAIDQLKSGVGKIIVDEPSGTLLLIDTPEKLQLMEKAIAELDKPLETAIFDLNYSDPEKFTTYLEGLVTPNLGKVIVDERSQKVMVTDLPHRVNVIRELVAAFDEQPPQVFIEGKIIQVTLKDEFSHGIEWEKLFSQTDDSLDIKGAFPVSLGYYGQLTVGTLDTHSYNIVFNFLQHYYDLKVLSSPQIVAVNNQEAKILVGKREAYITETLSQAETVVTTESIEFVDVGTKLTVTPTIGKDGFITMRIKPEITSVYDYTPENRIPLLDTSEAETVVKVKDGHTIMIGGLLKEREEDARYEIPFISKLPFLRFLFGSHSRKKLKEELVIFLTPHIITGAEKVEAKAKLIEPRLVEREERKIEEVKEEEKVEEEEIEEKPKKPPIDEELGRRLKKLKEY
jgi:type II secretory pathway component GspD/PulD (secretin)